MDTDISKKQAITIDDELWEELMDLTEGAIAPCFQCGVCTTACPWDMVREDGFTVRSLLRNAQVGSLEGFEQLWTCTSCAQCESLCPRGVPIASVIRSLRYMLWKRRQLLPGLPTALWSIFWNNNPWSQPPSLRSGWAKNLNVPIFDPAQHEILLYIGCTPSYDRRAQQIARSFVALLQQFGISFGFLGDEEPCCGESVLSLGHKPYFMEIANKNAKLFHEKGVDKLVTLSPHCYDVFLNHYPKVDDQFEVFHYTQILQGLLQEGQIPFHQTFERKVTFHDPCFLGRWNQEYDAPRQVLEAIPGIVLVEMERHGPDALCCGGGGGRMWMETPVGERFSDLRVEEAKSTGASIIATACPFCIACLEDSIKAQKIEHLEVLDIAEIAIKAVG
jgi:Fe-S oxidoreductase